METVQTVVVSAVVSALVALLLPWSKWGVEFVKQRQDRRREKIARWREGVEAFDFVKSGPFGATPLYSEMRPFLSEKLIKSLEHGRIVPVAKDGRGGGSAWKGWLLDEVTGIERRWWLV